MAVILIFSLIFHVLTAPNARAAEALFKADGSCSRSFIYRNRTYPLDSSRKLDGEGLRQLFTPEHARTARDGGKFSQAETLLNDYQAQLRASNWPAYVGTLGIVAAIGGSIYANTLTTPLGQRDTRYTFILSGLFLVVSSYAYGQIAIVQKEKTLEKAVDTYNDAVPNVDRIRVDLGPVSTGTGGEIKTEVPF